MANAIAPNFPIPSPTNVFACIWKLTRCMKASGWIYKASGVAGSTTASKEVSGVSTADWWGGSPTPMADTYTNISTTYTGTSGALNSFPTLSVASTTGFPASGTISVFTESGWADVAYTGGGGGGTSFTGCSTVSTGQIKSGYPIASGSGNIGLDQVAAWIVLQGPTTLKIPISAAPTGVSLRGEKVTQAISLAEGELRGFVWDSVGGSGWAVVIPRTGAETFDTTNVITGAASTATFTPTGVITKLVREVMFYKSGVAGAASLVNGAIFYGCFDDVVEATQRWSAIAAASTACVGNVGPGQGGAGNTFPAQGLIIRGTINSTAVGAWFSKSTMFQNNAQIGAANCTSGPGVSADGSFYIVVPNTANLNTTYFLGLQYVETADPGDCDPYVFLTPLQYPYTSWGPQEAQVGTNDSYTLYSLTNNSYPNYIVGYQARGHATLDTPTMYVMTRLANRNGNDVNGYALTATGGLTTPMRVLNTPAAAPPLVIEPVSFATGGGTYVSACPLARSHIKGRARWFVMCQIGNTYDTFANKSFVGLSVSNGGTTPCYAIGPYDGVTTPVQ